MRSSYIHPNSTPPRQVSRQPSRQFGASSPLTASPASPNGDENRLAVRSSSTTKMISTLQKEMDAIKGSSEAARAAAGYLWEV
jgi:hypothetical protein